MKVRGQPMLLAAVLIALAMGAPAVPSTMDDRIESSARGSYVFKTYLKDDEIKIQVRNGVVTLTGTVAEQSHIALAEETVGGLPGVRSVDNRLSVQGGGAQATPDAWIKDKVKFTLLFHRSVSALKTQVEVRDGVVTLRGEAENQAQKELTAAYAKDVEGVKSVENAMTVSQTGETAPRTAGDAIDDASITAQVKLTLLFHRATGVLRTSVATNDGVVTVSGEARNAAERDLVTKLVEDINGVKTVINGMTVEKTPGR